WPPLAGDLQSLRLAPSLDFCMISGEQHVRNFLPLEFAWAGKMRIFEEPGLKTLLGAGMRFAHHAGQQAHASVANCHRRNLAAREHIIANRNFLKISRRDNSLIDAFKAAADEHDALARSKRARTRLGKDSAAGRKQQARAIVVLVKRGI